MKDYLTSVQAADLTRLIQLPATELRDKLEAEIVQFSGCRIRREGSSAGWQLANIIEAVFRKLERMEQLVEAAELQEEAVVDRLPEG